MTGALLNLKLMNYKLTLNIYINKSRYRCSVCYIGKEAEMKLQEGADENSLMEVGEDSKNQKVEKSLKDLIKEYKEHTKVVETILADWKKRRENIKSGEVLMYHDFTTLHESTKTKVNLYIVFFFINNENNLIVNTKKASCV